MERYLYIIRNIVTFFMLMVISSSSFAREPKYLYEFDLGNEKGKAKLEVQTDLKGHKRLKKVELLFIHNNIKKPINLKVSLRPSIFWLRILDANGDGYSDFLVSRFLGAGPFQLSSLYVYSESEETFIKDTTFPEEFASIKKADTKGCLLQERRGGFSPKFKYITAKWCFKDEWIKIKEWPSEDNW